jgi:hypothetical protein
MRKLWLIMLCTLAFLGTAAVSEANIFVTISDGPRTLTASTNLLRLSQTITTPSLTAPDTTTTMFLLTCTAPCTAFFPSGKATQQNGDTFKIQDVSSTNRARIEVLDAATSSDRISFKGVKFTSVLPLGTSTYAAKTLTVTYGTQSGNLRTLSSLQAQSYFVSAAFSGSFKNSTGLSRATACKAGTVSTDMDTADDVCARLSVVLNGTGVDGQGNTVSATVAVACNNSFPTLNPCGTNGSWAATTGTFTGVNDGRSLSCPSTCSPVQVATLTGKFNGVNEVLQLTASLNGVIANVTDENGGVEDATLALAGEVGLNTWVTTSANNERCKAVPKAPTTNDTRNITNNSSLPISFEYWCGQLSPAESAGIPLVSLADTLLLPGAASTRYSASRETFLPTPGSLQFKNIQTLTFNYDVIVTPPGTPETPPDTRLDPISYSDCRDGSIRLEIQLVDSSGADQGTIKVYLGSTPEDFYKNGCDAVAAMLGVDIKGNPNARVDLSGLVGNLASPCCVSFSDAQKGNVGNQQVRRIAFIVSRPVSPPADPDKENYKVQFVSGSVNGITVTGTPPQPGEIPPQGLLQVVTNFVRKTDLSTNGVSITITKLTSPRTNNADTGVVAIIRSGQIVINGGKFTTSVNVNQIHAESQASYSIALCPNGAETDFTPDPINPNPVVGLCIADQGRMTLQ